MDEKDEKAVKNRISQARQSYGEGCGLVRRWPLATLNRISLRPGRIWLQRKVDRAQEGAMPGILTSFLFFGRNNLVALPPAFRATSFAPSPVPSSLLLSSFPAPSSAAPAYSSIAYCTARPCPRRPEGAPATSPYS